MKPSIHMPRSRLDLSYGYKTMFNEGDLIPFYIQEVYPGDSLNCDTTAVVRTTVPFKRPIMDNLFLDTYYFFVPNRLSYNRWNEVLGENPNSAWENPSMPDVPQVKLGSSVSIGTLADYFGLPTGTLGDSGMKVSQLPFRAYALITNEWFRNENITDPAYVNTGDNPTSGGSEVFPTINGNVWSASNIFGLPFQVNKYKDYFTSCLPEPQKGDAVNIKVLPQSAPVVTGDVLSSSVLKDATSLKWASIADGNVYTPDAIRALGIYSTGGTGTAFDADLVSSVNTVVPANLHAELAGFNVANVNDLRYAFALQRMLEKDARGGTRYVEYLYNHFGVVSPDARLQRPEFLGGRRCPLNVSQVAQTSGTDGSNYQAQVSGFSLSSGFSGFKKGFVEHGFVIGVCCVRQKHTYQQGLDKFWMRKSKYDYYDPSFAFIGEQPVYNYEIFGSSAVYDQVFGYNEAYADLRFRFSKVTGMLKTSANAGFDIWHLADSYVNTPVLNDTFIKENPYNLDRALAVASDTAPQFIIDAYHKVSGVRVIPAYGIPGLIDHM